MTEIFIPLGCIKPQGYKEANNFDSRNISLISPK